MKIITSVPVTGEAFYDRVEILDTIENRIKSFISGSITHVAIVGTRKIGKTSVLLEASNRTKDIKFIYMNLEVLVTSPLDFSISYINETINQIKGEDLETASDLEDYALKHKTGYSRVLLKLLKEYRNKNHPLCLKLAFDFPELLAKEEKIKILVLYDEFQDILEFNRYKLNPLAIFRNSFQRQKEILYMVSGSYVRVLYDIIRNPKSPLFGHFTLIELKNFDKNTSKAFIREILEIRIDPKALNFFVNFVSGKPYYIQLLCLELNDLVRKNNKQIIDEKLISEAIINQVIRPNGDLYQYCKYLYDTTLERARGGGILKKIVLLIADGINLPAILAKEMNMTIQSLLIYLIRLLEVDIIIKLGNKYVISDNVFKFWIVNTYLNIKSPLFEDVERRITKIKENLYEQIAKLKTERGIMFESYVKEIISKKFKGQKVSGNFFNVDKEVQVPTIKEIKNVDEGGIEIECLLIGSENWLVEIKGKFGEASGSDIKKFVKKKEEIEKIEDIKIDKLWFISESDFKKGAYGIAKKEGVLLSNRKALEDLQ